MRPWAIIVLALTAGGLTGWFWPELQRVPLSLPAPSQGVGARFPDLPLVGGRLANLAETRGKVVFINVWAEWCGPCLSELPSIQRLHDRFGRSTEVVFVLIGWRSDRRLAMEALGQKGIRLDHYDLARRLTEDEQDALFSGRGGIPRTFILDRQGIVRHMAVGSRDWMEAEGLVWDLIHQ